MSNIAPKSLIADAGTDSVAVSTGIGTADLLNVSAVGVTGNLLAPGIATFAGNKVTILDPGEYDIQGSVEWSQPNPLAVGANSLTLTVRDDAATILKSGAVRVTDTTASVGDLKMVYVMVKLILSAADIAGGLLNVIGLYTEGTADGSTQNGTLRIMKMR